MNFLKDSKNRIIAYCTVLIVILLGINIMLHSQNNKIVNDYAKSTEMCYFWIVKDDGVGFASPTEYCGQLNINCNADYHNLSCQWVQSEAVDRDGNLLNKTIQGCECEGK